MKPRARPLVEVLPRELPPASEMVKPRDAAAIEVLSASGWDCLHCPPPSGSEGAATTVEWLPNGGPSGEEFGRCRECGQKYVLADAGSRWKGGGA